MDGKAGEGKTMAKSFPSPLLYFSPCRLHFKNQTALFPSERFFLRIALGDIPVCRRITLEK